MGSDAVLALGKKLVAESGLDDSSDTLGRWMVHYVAELMQAAETAEPEARQELMGQCCAVIFDLWQHRSVLPNGKRPFENIEPILRALESLDPENEVPRYFRSLRPDKIEGEQEPETWQWLELADSLDSSAKLLIQHCLAQAAEHALNRSREWVKQAAEAGAEHRLETLVIRFLSAEGENLNPEDENGKFLKRLESRIARLDAFIKTAKQVSVDWRAQLKAGAGKPSVPDVAEVDTSKTE
jgi:hypothetical protein